MRLTTGGSFGTEPGVAGGGVVAAGSFGALPFAFPKSSFFPFFSAMARACFFHSLIKAPVALPAAHAL